MNLLTNKNSFTNAINGSDVSPYILNNHFCSVHSKMITTDESSNNSLIALKQYCTERIRHKGKPIPFMTVSGVCKSLCHIRQSSTIGTDGIDGKILRLSAPFIIVTITFIYNLIIEKNKFPKVFKEVKVIPLYKSGEKSESSNHRPILIYHFSQSL